MASIILALKRLGAAKIFLSNRTKEKAENLKKIDVDEIIMKARESWFKEDKKDNKKIKAAIVIIGNEILSGRTQDANVPFLAKWLNDLGVNVGEVRIIEDKEKSIISCIREIKDNFKYIFTTGGIGPTHDDITAESISKAFDLKFEMQW